MKLESRSRLVMVGDSVTDCGRLRPVGEGPGDALGFGYVAQVDAHLRATYPGLGVRVVNQGVGGDTIRDLKRRWSADVEAQRPDWLSVMIGINDVWRQFGSAGRADAVPPDEFAGTYRELLAPLAPSLRGLALLTPFVVEPDRSEPMRARMDEYGAIVRRVAAEQGAIVVDTQAAFNRALASEPAAALAPDRVHPTQAGHRVLARAFLEAMDFAWPR